MRIKNDYGFGLVWVLALFVLLAVVASGYFIYQSNDDEGNDSTNSQVTTVEQQEDTPVETEEVNKTKGITITTAENEFGTMLFDDKGQAIYIWELEESSTPECYGDCAEAWPPVYTVGAPQAVGDTKSELLGTTIRSDGTTQVTYNNKPLYYYAHENPGEVLCHNVSTHGGLWWVIQPDGVQAD